MWMPSLSLLPFHFANRARERAVSRSRSRSRSPTPTDVPSASITYRGTAPPTSHRQRPLSVLSEDLPPSAALEVTTEPPTAISAPNTPLLSKRETMELPSPPLDNELPSPERRLREKEEKAKSLSPPPDDTTASPPEEPAKPPLVWRPSQPEFLQQRFAFDDIRDLLDATPEKSGDQSYEGIPPLEPTWLDKPTGIEQLQAFLAVCA